MERHPCPDREILVDAQAFARFWMQDRTQSRLYCTNKAERADRREVGRWIIDKYIELNT